MSVKSLSDKSLVLSLEIRIAKKDPPPDLEPLKIVPCKICRHTFVSLSLCVMLSVLCHFQLVHVKCYVIKYLKDTLGVH